MLPEIKTRGNTILTSDGHFTALISAAEQLDKNQGPACKSRHTVNYIKTNHNIYS